MGVGGDVGSGTSASTGVWINYASSNFQWSFTTNGGRALVLACIE